MRIIWICLNTVLLSLAIALLHRLDVGEPITNTRDLLTADKLGTNGCRTVGTLIIGRLMGCPGSEKHSSQSYSIPHLAPPPSGRYTARIGTMLMSLAATVWLIWYLRCDVENRSRGLSAHQFGRTEAVTGPASSQFLAQGDPPLHDSDSVKPQSHSGRSATVVSADGALPPTPPLVRVVDPLSPAESLEGLKDLEEINLQTTPFSDAFQRLVAVACRMPQTWSKPPSGQLEQTVTYLPTRPPTSSSLRRSLYQGSQNLDESPSHPGRFIFLAVSVDLEGQKDAENDTEYLRQMFKSSTLRFEHISGPTTTFSNVHETVLALLGDVQATSGPSQIFMLFTGTGDDNNAMCLANDEALSESDVNQWVLASAVDQTNESGIGILFDICRKNMSQLTTTFQSVKVARSCSVGEYAYAIRISKDKLIPRSIFLLAIFLAAHDLVHKPGGCFETAFTFHIKQLSELIQFMHRRYHQEQCSRYPTHEQCEAPRPQTPDLQQAGHVVASLGGLIATHFPQHACEVFVAVNHKMLQEGFGGLFCPFSALCAQQSNKPTVKDES